MRNIVATIATSAMIAALTASAQATSANSNLMRAAVDGLRRADTLRPDLFAAAVLDAGGSDDDSGAVLDPGAVAVRFADLGPGPVVLRVRPSPEFIRGS